jgi:FkbH-like protein
VKAQLSRQQFRAEAVSESDYVASLQITCRVERLAGPAKLDRIEELFARTTQFNTTGRRFPATELQALVANPSARIFTLHVSDKFGDHGLVGAAIVESGAITGLVLSCRVLGLGVEHRFMQHIITESNLDGLPVTARIIETARNAPVRNIYRDNGFARDESGVWRRAADIPAATEAAA